VGEGPREPLPERDDAGQKRDGTDEIRQLDTVARRESQHRHIEVRNVDRKNREAENYERCPKPLPHVRKPMVRVVPTGL
jgi:hypothetical protein